jgi:predicted neutral ceramidase superfamily lipid hydrolase
MTQAVRSSPPRTAQRDLTARQAIVAACLAMTAIALLDLVDSRLDLLYSVGFVLIVVTAPLAVGVRQMFATGVLPSVLLIASLLLVCLFQPSAIQVEGMDPDAGTAARLIAATLDHGLTLVIGQVLAFVVIILRILGDARSGVSR